MPRSVPGTLASRTLESTYGTVGRWWDGAKRSTWSDSTTEDRAAFGFVQFAREFLPFGFAAGAMIYLVLSEFIPSTYRRHSTSARVFHGMGSLNSWVGLSSACW